MIKELLVVSTLCVVGAAAYAQYVPEPFYQQAQPRSALSYKCAQASEYIKNNNCGPQGCDIGLCVALSHGCHINNWGHVCPYPYPYTPFQPNK
jgi:hypothetical protein